MTDFSTLTACGECCTGCAKKISGACAGCIEAEGRVPEWAESGVCRVYACVKRHNALFCGLCEEFPCADINKIIPWNADIVAHLTSLRNEYLMQNRTDIEIVPVTSENAADAGNIIYTSWGETYRGLMPDEVLDGRQLDKCVERARENCQNYRLALVNGEAAGTVVFLPETRDFCTHRSGGEVVALYVLKKFQQLGLGRALLETAIENVGRDGLTLFVLKGNENAVAFYKRMGFEFTGSVYEDAERGMTDLEMYRAGK